MNDELIQKLVKLNSEYIPKFLANSHEHEEVLELSSEIPALDENNVTKYGLDYYDLMIVNILLKRHTGIKCELTANIAEITTRIAYEGLRHMKIMSDKQAYDLCNDIALNRVPDRLAMYQYMNFVLRYKFNVLPYWFYYTLLLWAFVDTKKFKHVPYRSRIFVGIIHACGLTNFTDYTADHTHDVFNVREKLTRIIQSCIKDERFENDYDGYIEYMVDSLRIFSIIILSMTISRSCHWPEFKLLGNEVVTQILLEHQKVIDVSYKTLIKQGEQKC